MSTSTAAPLDFWNLNTLWFFLIAVLWMGYFLLEGFDFGVGILTRFLAKDDVDRRVLVNTIGPVWDGNEVWLLVAGGATFAAFPEWYATLFSGFYLALFLVLVALIWRGIAFELRGKLPGARWRRLWDEGIFWGSAVPALLFGVAFANILRGVPVDAQKEYAGTFFDLLNPYALWAGVTTLLLFTVHGALYLTLKTRGELAVRARDAAIAVSWIAALALFVFLGWTFGYALATGNAGIVPGPIPLAALAAAIAAAWLVRVGDFGRTGWAFVCTGAAIALTTLTIFLNLYPRVLVSSVDPSYSLTIFTAASTPYTLTVMSVVALTLVPFVVVYQGWTYWVFRHRLSRSDFEPAAPAALLGGAPLDHPSPASIN